MIRITALAALVAIAAPVKAAEIKVFATGAVSQAVQDIVGAFEKDTGHKIVASFGTAGGIGKKLADGEKADVVFSSLGGLRDSKAFLVEAEPMVVGRVRMGMAVKQGAARPDISSADKFKDVLLGASSVSWPDPAQGATTGIHFSKTLEQMGILEQMKAKAVYGRDGADVSKAVAEGKAQIGFTQTTEIQGVPGVDVGGMMPDTYQLVSSYAVALTKEGATAAAAKDFFAAVTSAKGVDVFARRGFDVK